MIQHDPERLKSNIRASLEDQALREAVGRAARTTLEKRTERVAATPHWEALRREAARIRAAVVEQLDDQLQHFARQCEQGGIRVHWAEDASAACERVAALARERGATRVVKSKSMVTEEIGLNDHLIRCGIDTVETDLGEYIVQLAGEPPSQLTAPALHKRREDIGRLFERELGVAYTDDPAELTAIARDRLRSRFLEAEIGVSGVNFGLVREGALVVVENEGNALLSTQLPRVHVAVMGIERLLPSLDDLPTFLELLPSSATGQAMTGYVHVIRGPAPVGACGPEEVHLVLVDNGRTRVLADPDHRALLTCIRCGACQLACPVYQQVGGHAYGWTVQGPIGAALGPFFLGPAKARDLPFASSLCGVCAEVCPVGIDLPGHLLRLRRDAVDRKLTPAGERLAVRGWSWTARRPRVWRTVTGLVRCVGWLPARAWKRTRDLPRPARRSFLDRWRKEPPR